jgi:predicted TIM-barrel fold metal-dependent hydrolase
MSRHIRFLDQEGIECQFLYPSIGLLLDGFIEEPELAAAHCRAYNTWTLERCAGYRNRLYPVGHISLRHPTETVREMHRLAKEGVRSLFVGAMPVNGKSFGHPDFDPIWATAQELDLSVGIHLVVHPYYLGNEWHKEPLADFMYVSMSVIQDPRMALTTMVYDGVFERFPKLRVAFLESGCGWVPYLADRLDESWEHRRKRWPHPTNKSPSEIMAAGNLYYACEREEKTLATVAQLIGPGQLLWASDFPHERSWDEFSGDIDTLVQRKDLPESLPRKILFANPRRFYKLPVDG